LRGRAADIFYPQQGFPFAKTDKREIRADHSDDSVRIKFILNPAQSGVRKDIDYRLTGVDENFVRRKSLTEVIIIILTS
jgi:hypothetical protein